MMLSFAQSQSNRNLSRTLNASKIRAGRTTLSKPRSKGKTITKSPLNTTGKLQAAQAPTVLADQFFRLKLTDDSAYYDDIMIRFSQVSTDKYNPKEDAFDIAGSDEPHVSLSSYSSNHIPLAVNKTPFPAHSKKISLFVNAMENSIYHLKANDLANIPSHYSIRLKDKLNGKVLNLRITDHYDFNIDKNVAASFGERLEVIITNGH